MNEAANKNAAKHEGLSRFGAFCVGARSKIASNRSVPASRFAEVAREIGIPEVAVAEAIADLAHFQEFQALRPPGAGR